MTGECDIPIIIWDYRPQIGVRQGRQVGRKMKL